MAQCIKDPGIVTSRGAGLIPDPGISACHRLGQNKQTNRKPLNINITSIGVFPIFIFYLQSNTYVLRRGKGERERETDRQEKNFPQYSLQTV